MDEHSHKSGEESGEECYTGHHFRPLWINIVIPTGQPAASPPSPDLESLGFGPLAMPKREVVWGSLLAVATLESYPHTQTHLKELKTTDVAFRGLPVPRP